MVLIDPHLGNIICRQYCIKYLNSYESYFFMFIAFLRKHVSFQWLYLGFVKWIAYGRFNPITTSAGFYWEKVKRMDCTTHNSSANRTLAYNMSQLHNRHNMMKTLWWLNVICQISYSCKNRQTYQQRPISLLWSQNRTFLCFEHHYGLWLHI